MTEINIFDQMAMDIFSSLGKPVTYTPVAGTPVTVNALISTMMNTQPSGMGSETWSQHVTIEFLLSDLSNAPPSPGDVVMDGSIEYTIAAVIENNGQLVKCVVT